METVEFVGLNVIILGIGILGVMLYLIFLIRKRQKQKFLHQDTREK